MSNLLHISSSPHIKNPKTTCKIMLDVIISLLPALIAGTVIFGSRALLVVAVCVAVSVISEYLFNLILKREQTIWDLSAVVTGLILGLNLNANTPLWQAGVGAFFAIIVVKSLFGGLGKNVVNPALTARVFMVVAFASMSVPSFPLDSVATATPLADLNTAVIDPEFAYTAPKVTELLFGTHGGAIGETCALAIIIGGIYLIIRGVITFHIPVIFVATVFGFTLLISGDINLALYAILTGGLLFGSFFMATDYVTSPATAWGKTLYAILAGLITCLIRYWGNYPEGVSFAILLVNILYPYIERWTNRKLFGGDKK